MNTSIATTPLDVPTAILQRRSIKTFLPKPISSELLKQLVELTIAAPSSFNLQPWRIVIVQDSQQKVNLCTACWNQEQVTQAPATFVFAADASVGDADIKPILDQGSQAGAWNEKTVNYLKNAIPTFQQSLGAKRREYAIKDAMIASTNLVLAAESLGLSTCFLNGWEEAHVKEVIGVADNPDIAIAVLVTVGYAAQARLNPGRLPLSDNVYVDSMNNPYQS
ncbi:MAG: nitroreductase [Sphaerospermopsis sp. SIO1G1]|nr:nitroreductase [Sphaerospermopsis sp. SIO1G1]